MYRFPPHWKIATRSHQEPLYIPLPLTTEKLINGINVIYSVNKDWLNDSMGLLDSHYDIIKPIVESTWSSDEE